MTCHDKAPLSSQRPAIDRAACAALFDLDGVITSTAEVHLRAWAER